MNSKRMRLGLVALAVYAALGMVGLYTGAPCVLDCEPTLIAGESKSKPAAAVERTSTSAPDLSVEWQSFLPGAFK